MVDNPRWGVLSPHLLTFIKMNRRDIKKVIGIYSGCIDSLKLETRTRHYSNKIVARVNQLRKDYSISKRTTIV